MIKTNFFIILIMFSSFSISAHNIVDNQKVPPVGISDKGEINYANNDFSYKNWNSSQLSGKARVIQHIAGRTSAKEMNAPLIEAIKKANLPREHYQTTTIVNTDDAVFGTSIFVINSIEDNKKTFPWSQFIIDSKGAVRKEWNLDNKSSTIVVLDQKGNVRFVKDGALTQKEVQQVIDQLHQMVKE